MWELARARSFGRLSLPNILLFAAAMVVALFTYSFLFASTAHAADAQWKDASTLTYDTHDYTPETKKPGKNDPRGFVEDALIYTYTDPVAATPKVIHYIIFPPNADPPTETTATHEAFEFTPPSTYTSLGKTSIALTPAVAASTGTTSCDSTLFEGMGWILCPLTNGLAKGMDYIYGLVSEFLTVRPVQTNQDNALFRAWAFMRNFANVAFVIGFLVIIYSQLTSLGISNYALKKMLPRLVIAAILVNVSYWICAVAIDISNILGYSIQDIFIGIRNSLVGTEGNSWNAINAHSIAGFVLAGGAGAAALGVGTYVFIAGAAGSIYLLLPILLGVLMAVLVALLVMAARQAIITILVIISPLAFVAYLLPNTEKYFEKWRALGFTMLLMFPMFSVIFGGSQLAAAAIIQNADSINLIILALAVQVAPLAITPLLMRVSGSLLTKIGGIVNNPGKGLIDRTRQWSQERADQHKAHQLANGKSRMANWARSIDSRRRKREGWQKANDATTEAKWGNTEAGLAIQQQAMKAAQLKEKGDVMAQARFESLKHTNAEIQNVDVEVHAAKAKLDLSKATVEANQKEFTVGNIDNLVTPAHLAGSALTSFIQNRNAAVDSIADDTLHTAVESRRAQSAENIHQNEFSAALQASAELRERAGGIDPNGAQRALADALSKQHSIRGEAVKTANAIIEHSNLTPASITRLALGYNQGSVIATDDIMEAAIKRIAGGKNLLELQNLLDNIDVTPESNENHRIAFSEALLDNNMRPKFVTATIASKFAQGIVGGLGEAGVDQLISEAVHEGKYSADVWAGQEKISIIRVKDAIERHGDTYTPEARDKLRKQINEAKTNINIMPRLGEREAVMDEIDRLI